jgi:cytidyltransferase-like protein
MKSFLEVIEEEKASEHHHVFTFGRMNPPTTGHLKLIDKVKEVAKKHNATHTVVTSHSQDAKKNPLSAEQKVKHLKRYSPGTNFQSSSKEHPTFLHHAAELHKKGVTHLHMVVGSDRVKEMHQKLHQYNGTHEGALHNFKKITVHSAGHRDPDAEGTEGMSGTKMREHSKNKDLSSFKKGVPGHVSDTHAKELMHDTRKGMGLHENYNRGLFRAIFVTGGPGSGKDIIIREAIAEAKVVELNSAQAFDYLMDKQKLSEKTSDYRREAIRNRGPLIINGPADDHTRILTIKEELEELGYSTTMVFVDTTNEASKERNERLTKTLAESIRYDKWKLAQTSKQAYIQNFQNFMEFNNSGTLEEIEEDISDTYEKINTFIENKKFNEIAFSWLENHGKYSITDSVFKEDENVKKNFRFVENYKTKRTGTGQTSTGHPKISAGTGPSADGPGDITPDNRAGDSNADNIKWDRNAKRGGYAFRTYTEDTGPKVQVFPAPQESNFSKDKEKIKKKGLVDSPTVSQRMRNVSVISQEFDTRQQGTVYPMSGLGDVTYREQVDFRKFRESFNDPADSEMGVGGVLGGASNKEPMENPKDKMGYFNKKKKK